MYYILLIAAIFTLPLINPVYASGTSSGYGQYGSGSPAAGILVDKTVSRGDQTKGGIMKYVDNFSPSDARFTANQRVYFQIKVKNTTTTVLKNVQLSDVLPEYTDAVEGPGDYNATSRMITWTYSELRPGEERNEKLILQIKPQSQLPADRGTFCISNKAAGVSGDFHDDDTAQFCIEKTIANTVGGVPDMAPQAGPEFGLLFGALNISALGTGIYLRKKAN